MKSLRNPTALGNKIWSSKGRIVALLIILAIVVSGIVLWFPKKVVSDGVLMRATNCSGSGHPLASSALTPVLVGTERIALKMPSHLQASKFDGQRVVIRGSRVWGKKAICLGNEKLLVPVVQVDTIEPAENDTAI